MNKFIPHGTLLVKVRSENRLYSINDLQLINDLTIGQLFLAVATLHDKSGSDFGIKWPSFANKRNEFKVLEKEINSCRTDYEKLVKICGHLSVDVPTIVPNEKILID